MRVTDPETTEPAPPRRAKCERNALSPPGAASKTNTTQNFHVELVTGFRNTDLSLGSLPFGNVGTQPVSLLC